MKTPSGASAVACLAAAALVCFGVLLWAPIIYDDQWFLMANPLVTGPWPGLRAFFTSHFWETGDYAPLVTLGHWLLHAAVGPEPFFYRATSLALHAAVAALAFDFYRRRVRPDLAFWAALLFALFPSHAEVLAQTSFKKHQAVAAFGLALLSLRERSPGDGWPRALGGAALLALALLCRESALMLLPLCWLAARGRREPRAWAALALTAAGFLAWRTAVAPRLPERLAGGELASHLMTSVKIALWHAGQLLAPVSLSLEHSLRPTRSPWWLAAALAAAWAARRLAGRDPVSRLGLAWTGLLLLPFLNIIPFANFSLVANRYHYAAAIGFFLLAARLAERARVSERAAAAGALAAALAYAGLGLPYARLFTSPVELWAHAVERAPDHPRALAGLGAELRRLGRLEEAAGALGRAVELAPAYPEPYLDLTWALDGLGRSEEALAAARRRLQVQSDPPGLANLGVLELKLGRAREAYPKLLRVAELAPSAESFFDLGQCQAALGLKAQARRSLERASQGPALRARALAELAALGD